MISEHRSITKVFPNLRNIYRNCSYVFLGTLTSIKQFISPVFYLLKKIRKFSFKMLKKVLASFSPLWVFVRELAFWATGAQSRHFFMVQVLRLRWIHLDCSNHRSRRYRHRLRDRLWWCMKPVVRIVLHHHSWMKIPCSCKMIRLG